MKPRSKRPLCVAVLLAAWSAIPASAFAQGATPLYVPPTGVQSASDSSSGPPAHVRTPPRLTHFVNAPYPDEARTQEIEGPVLLQLDIDEHGRVTEATVLEGLGHGLDEAAVAAALQFTFDPAQDDGHPIAARIRYRYRFTLTVAASAAPRGPVAVIEGVVRDSQNHPIPNPDVELRRDGQDPLQQHAGADGTFRFELDRPGVVTVVVDASGFREYRAEEQVQARDDLRVIYRLQLLVASSTPPPSAGETTVTVHAEAPPREVDRVTLERDEIAHIPGTGGDALRSIQNLPGLARPPFFSGALIVRGSSPADTQIFADGSGIPLLYHFGGLTSVIPTDMLDRIDFYPGNFSARYGRAMGGIVDVGLRSPRTDGYHGVVTLGLLDGSIFVEGKITSTLSLELAARRSWIDVVLGAVLSSSTGFNIVPVYYDYQAVLEWRPTPHNRVRLALFGDDDTLSIISNNAASGSQSVLAGGLTLHTQFHIGQLSWTFEPEPGTRSVAMLSFGYTALGLAAGGASLAFNLGTYPINARYELQHAVSRMLRLNVGFDFVALPFNVAVSLPTAGNGQSESLNINGYSVQPAMYAEAEITPTQHSRIVPGVRVDYFSDIEAAIVQPRLSARYEFGYGFSARGGVGLYAQPVSPEQSTTAANPFFANQSIGNPHLIPQRAMHYAIGVEERFPGIAGAPWLSHLSISLEGFYKTLDALVVTTPTYLQLSRPPAPPYESIGSGYVVGLEVLARYRSDGHFFGWLAYTLSQSMRQDGPGLPQHLYQYDETHIFTLIGSYVIGAGFEVGLRLRYVTGSLVTPIVGSFYDTSTLSYSPISGPTNSTRLPDFFELDLRVDKTFRFHWGRIGLFLEIFNLTNNGNVEGYQYNYDYSQRAAINGIPFFPNLGIRGEI